MLQTLKVISYEQPSPEKEITADEAREISSGRSEDDVLMSVIMKRIKEACNVGYDCTSFEFTDPLTPCKAGFDRCRARLEKLGFEIRYHCYPSMMIWWKK